MRISDWSSDVCSSDLSARGASGRHERPAGQGHPRQFGPADRCGQRSWRRGEENRRGSSRGLMIPPLPLRERVKVDVYVNANYDAVHNLLRGRSEEHTSELQSLMRISYAVFCLQKKNQNIRI